MKKPYIDTKKNIRPAIILLLCLFIITVQSCKKKRSDMANILYKKTQNKVFKKLEPDAFADVFKNVLDSEKSKLANPDLIISYYDQNDYDPIFMMKHLQNDDIKKMISYYDRANENGLDSTMFQPAQIRALVNKFYNKKAIKTVDEAYHDMAELEMLTANSLINYSNALQYGIVNPKKIYSRYFTVTAEADTNSMMKVFRDGSLTTYLDSIQPADPQYKALQKAYISGETLPGLSKEESQRVLQVNLERLRWKNKPKESKYVIVNIPDFHLDVMDNGKSVLGMKVCVGKGRNSNYAKNLMNYVDTDKIDRPVHETPLLNSLIHSAEVNPVWNIPESIVNKEIIVQAEKDPYYLSNKNIDVYKNGQKIENSDSINWSEANKDEYEFKQEPGDDNALGKIKFLFNNKSSVYLHDTNAKSAFGENMRAVSHGCVRLEKPLDLAHELFGDGPKYDLIAADMGADKPDPTTISLPKKVPVYITYVTCWADSTGTLQYRGDVYGQDIILYANLKKELSK